MRKYYTISWKILTVQEACPYYQSQEDQKQQSLELRGCQHALSVKNKISKSQIRVLAFFQKIGWKQSSCEWKNLEYQPKHMMSEKWKTFVMGTRLEKAS